MNPTRDKAFEYLLEFKQQQGISSQPIQVKEKWFLTYSKITILTILSYLIINFIIQLFYYKWFLYIVYGNNKS